MTLECNKVSGINLAQGVCDTALPPPVAQAAHEAIERGHNSYTRFDGIPELRQAIAEDLFTRRRLRYSPDGEIIVTSGATGAFYVACAALLEPADEVLLFEPYYGYHAATVTALGGVAVPVPLRPPSWTFTRAALEAAYTARTRALVVNTPANPSGKVFDDVELNEIAEFARDRDLTVITDEIYEHFLYDGRPHRSPADLPALRDRTIMIGGFSKTFAVTGWRIGFLACPADLAAAMGALNDLIYVCAPAPLQHAVAAGLALLPSAFYQQLATSYQRKRDLVCAALRDAGLEPHVPQGAYYVLADVSRIAGRSSKERALRLLAETKVATVPGCAFGNGPELDQLVRFCFAKDDAVLDDVCERLRRWSRMGR